MADDYPDELSILDSPTDWPPSDPGELLNPDSRKTPFLWGLANQGAFEAQAATDAARLTVPVYVRWDGWQKALRNFLGYSLHQTAVDGDKTYKWVSRATPMPYPDWFRLSPVDGGDGLPWMYAVSAARVEGCGPRGYMEGTRAPRYAVARIHLTFAGLPYQILEDDDPVLQSSSFGAALGTNPDEATLLRYVSGPYWKPFQRQVTLRRGLMKPVPKSGDPADVAKGVLTEGIGLPEPGSEVTYVWHQVPKNALPIEAIMNCMGRVNAEEFDIFPPETLLFETPDITPHQSPVGADIYDIQYRFKFLPRGLRGDPNIINEDEEPADPDAGLPQGWNSMLTYIPPDPPFEGFYDYRRYTLGGGAAGDPAFRPADFLTLFRPDQPPPA